MWRVWSRGAPFVYVFYEKWSRVPTFQLRNGESISAQRKKPLKWIMNGESFLLGFFFFLFDFTTFFLDGLKTFVFVSLSSASPATAWSENSRSRAELLWGRLPVRQLHIGLLLATAQPRLVHQRSEGGVASAATVPGVDHRGLRLHVASA